MGRSIETATLIPRETTKNSKCVRNIGVCLDLHRALRASGLNRVGQAMAVTTTYDELYQTAFLMREITREMGYSSPALVTATDLDKSLPQRA